MHAFPSGNRRGFCEIRWCLLAIASCASFAGAIFAGEPLTAVARKAEQRLPEPRFGFATALDSKRHRIIMVGGKTAQKDAIPATRSLDLQTLKASELAAPGTGPANTYMASAVYEPERDAIFVFGGWPRGADAPSAELWMLSFAQGSNAQWRKLSDGSTGPRGRNGAGMVLDRARQRLILFGGDGGPHPKYGFTPLNDLWAYDLRKNAWQELTAKGDVPEPRWNHAVAVNEASGTMYLFGGAGYVGQRQVRDQDVFELDLAKLTWGKRAARGTPPPPLEGASLTHDTAANVLMVAGGLSLEDSGEPGYEHIWLFDLSDSSWRMCADRLDSTRREHGAVYDAARGQHVIIGGQTARKVGNYYEQGRPLDDVVIVNVSRRKQ